MQVRVFFEGLDEELNKVNQFYKTKETEFIERGEILNKQLQILLDLKQILNDRRWKNSGSRHVPSVPSSWSSSPRNSDCSSGKPSSFEIVAHVLMFLVPILRLVLERRSFAFKHKKNH